MPKQEVTDPKKMQDELANYAQLLSNIGQHAAEIAHARRVLYDAYLAEGFTESQALELCKTFSLI